MRFVSAAAALVVLLASASASASASARAAASPSTQPYIVTHITRENPPLRLHVVKVDLADPRVHLKVSAGGADPDGDGPWETTLLAVRDIARRDHLAVAVNGNFFATKDRKFLLGRQVPYFAGNWARCCGWAMSDGRLFGAHPLDRDWTSLVVFADGSVKIGVFPRPPAGATQIVSGVQQVVTAGRNTAGVQQAMPRTAAGLDADRKTLTLLVADGRRPDYSVGLTFGELGDEMIRQGCADAICLDGGGSSTLVVADPEGRPEVANRPSDGHDLPIPLSIERTVADALGVVVEEGTKQTQNAER